MRITIDNEKALNIASAIEVIAKHNKEKLEKLFYEDTDILIELAETIKAEYKKPINTNKRNATKKATIIRQEKVQRKIRDACERLHNQGRSFTVYSISKETGVSYNTVKKYQYLLNSYDTPTTFEK